MSIRVLLVDDHTMLREALHLMLEQEPGMEVVGDLGDGKGVLEAEARLSPDVIVMDVSMPTVNGIEATRSLMRKNPAIRIVALSAFGYKQFIMEMMEAGALGYVIKSAAGEQLVRAIKSVARGETYLCPETSATLVAANHRNNSGKTTVSSNKRLGRREIEVLRLLAQGKSSPQIGNDLHIAPSTVDVHRRNIMDKLDLRSVAELTKYAIRTGLTSV
jgi:two-component system NarL family response regulator